MTCSAHEGVRSTSQRSKVKDGNLISLTQLLFLPSRFLLSSCARLSTLERATALIVFPDSSTPVFSLLLFGRSSLGCLHSSSTDPVAILRRSLAC